MVNNRSGISPHHLMVLRRANRDTRGPEAIKKLICRRNQFQGFTQKRLPMSLTTLKHRGNGGREPIVFKTKQPFAAIDELSQAFTKSGSLPRI
jgi:hypothetical protein